MTGDKIPARYRIDKSIADTLGFNPYYKSMQTGVNRPMINGKAYVDLASNNYLGIANDKRIELRMLDEIRKYGSSMCGTPIATGHAKILEDVECRLSQFCGLKAGMVFPSCYQANVSVLTALIDKEDIAFVDHYAHASLIQGIKASGCRIRPFLHNDTGHLQKLLETTAVSGQAFVVTESVFSTEGSIAPADVIADLCRQYGAIPVIDDSHGIGVIGKTGRGILEEKDMAGFDGIYTASLGKAIANAGGFVGGPEYIIDFLRYSCSGLIYSTALPPSVAGGILGAIEIIEKEFDRLNARMRNYRNRLSTALIANGFCLAKGDAPIISVLCQSSHDTVALAMNLYSKGILSTPFIPPSVPPKQGRVRLIAGAGLSTEDVDAVCSILPDIACGYARRRANAGDAE